MIGSGLFCAGWTEGIGSVSAVLDGSASAWTVGDAGFAGVVSFRSGRGAAAATVWDCGAVADSFLSCGTTGVVPVATNRIIS